MADELGRFVLDAGQRGCTLGLATGGTMRGIYTALVERGEALDFSRVTSVQLDEYVGLAPQDPRSFESFLEHGLFDHLDAGPRQRLAPDVGAVDLDAAAKDYEARLNAAGGLDFLLLGIGRNGHIAFNEPGSEVDSPTRVVELSSETLEDAAATFGGREHVPQRALTLGVAALRSARTIRLVALGERKAEALSRALREPATSCPASWLAGHADCRFVVDEAAAGGL